MQGLGNLKKHKLDFELLISELSIQHAALGNSIDALKQNVIGTFMFFEDLQKIEPDTEEFKHHEEFITALKKKWFISGESSSKE